MLRAVIGIGSNSTRLLVAEAQHGKLLRQTRMREGTRLFAGLSGGVLSGESMNRTAEAAARFAAAARDAGVADGDLHIIATSAARDAHNGDVFIDAVRTLTGVTPQILTGEEEAKLSFRGGAGEGYSGLIDIGGGSTEIAVGGGGRPLQAASAQLGAVRLFGEKPMLTGDGLEEAFALARERVAPVWAGMQPPGLPAAWYGVGGTLTTLASIDMRLPAFDRDAVDGHTLGRDAVENWARRLAKMPMDERARLPGMLPQRADIIAHGAIVLWAVMDALDIPRVSVSNRTNLDGYLLSLDEEQASRDPVETVRAYYDASVEREWERLQRNRFEFEINRHYIDRYVQPGHRVLDAGGGPGRYALHLAGRGADVTLLDLSKGNVDFAAKQAAEMELKLATVCCDARVLDEAVDGTYDVVLLMGPLYHLLEEADRMRTVEACLKVLKPGGVLCVAFISIVGGMVYAARELPESILWPGEHVFYDHIKDGSDFAGPGFTQAFMIQPDHVRPFMAQFPLEEMHLVASEGITAPFANQLRDAPENVRAAWLELSLAMCEREAYHSFTEHFLYIGRKKEA